MVRAYDYQKAQAFEERKLNGVLAIGDEGYDSTGVWDGQLLGWMASVSLQVTSDYLCSIEKLHILDADT